MIRGLYHFCLWAVRIFWRFSFSTTTNLQLTFKFRRLSTCSHPKSFSRAFSSLSPLHSTFLTSSCFSAFPSPINDSSSATSISMTWGTTFITCDFRGASHPKIALRLSMEEWENWEGCFTVIGFALTFTTFWNGLTSFTAPFSYSARFPPCFIAFARTLPFFN